MYLSFYDGCFCVQCRKYWTKKKVYRTRREPSLVYALLDSESSWVPYILCWTEKHILHIIHYIDDIKLY